MGARGDWLKSHMERRQITVRQMADALEVTQKTIYDWRDERTAISEARIPRLASVLGISEMEARRGLGYWVPEDDTTPPELDRAQLREALDRFRKAADDLERLINREH